MSGPTRPEDAVAEMNILNHRFMYFTDAAERPRQPDLHALRRPLRPDQAGPVAGRGRRGGRRRCDQQDGQRARKGQAADQGDGKKKRQLNETGKVKLNVAVTYTPTGGDPSTQSRKLKLKKR